MVHHRLLATFPVKKHPVMGKGLKDGWNLLLSLENLNISFKTTTESIKVVKNVSLNIEKSEILGLVGESGSGKTVLASSLLGMVESPGRIESGNFIFNSSATESLFLNKLTEKRWQAIRGRQISMIFQDPMNVLDPARTVGSQFMEAIRIHKPQIDIASALSIAVEMLNSVWLNNPVELLQRYSFELSGGMRQRVMIAMALVHQPQLLIADEPTTALDVTVQAQILDIFLHLKQRFNMAILFISHDLAVVGSIADRIAVMYNGQIVETGQASEVLKNPKHEYTQKLLCAAPRI